MKAATSVLSARIIGMRAPLFLADPTRRTWLIVCILTFIGFGLRIYHLNHSSLWMDEVLIMSRADPARSWGEFFWFSPDLLPHPAWHHGVVRVWLTIFGYTEFQGRFLSVIFGTISIPATYVLARSLAGQMGSLLAALAAAVSYYMIFYAQEVTAYAHWYAAICFSYTFFFALCRKASLWRGAGYTLSTLIALHVHFMAAFMIAAQFAAAAWFGLAKGGGWRVPLRFAVPGFILALSLVPMAETIRLGAVMPQFLTRTPGGEFPVQYFYIFFGDSIALATLAALPIAMVAFGKLHRWATNAPAPPAPDAPAIDANTGASMLLIMLVIGLAIHYVVSLTLKPMLFHRYTMYTLPLYLVLMAIGFELIEGAVKRWVYASVLVAMSLWVLLVTKNQYAVTVKFDQPRDVVAFVAAKNSELRLEAPRYVVNYPNLLHYYMRANGITAALEHYVEKEDIQRILSVAARGDYFWLLIDGWEPPPWTLNFAASSYEKILERRFARGYAGLYRLK